MKRIMFWRCIGCWLTSHELKQGNRLMTKDLNIFGECFTGHTSSLPESFRWIWKRSWILFVLKFLKTINTATDDECNISMVISLRSSVYNGRPFCFRSVSFFSFSKTRLYRFVWFLFCIFCFVFPTFFKVEMEFIIKAYIVF